MNLKELLRKMIAGEVLTDEEKQFVENYDPDSIAAAARRKAVSEAEQLKNELKALMEEQEASKLEVESTKAEKLTATQKLEKQMSELKEQIAQINQAKADAEAAAKKLVKNHNINKIRQSKGINWITGIDEEIVEGAFAKVFDDLDDFDNEEIVNARVAKFVEKNKALITDKSGHGTGQGASPAAVKVKDNKEISIEERAKNMKEKGLI
jgi:multidrug efflux pump subunit AcrA (membrane-fusion protein)